MRKMRKTLSLMVALVFLFSQCLPGIALADTHSTSLSTKDVVKKWVGTKLEPGYPSKFYTTGSITKAELASLLVKAFNLPSGTYPKFSDVPSKAWYKSAVGKATLAGIMFTTGRFNPYYTMSRQIGATIIYKAFRRTVPAVSNPKARLTRIQALQMIDACTNTRITKAGTYTGKIYKNVVISQKNVVMKNATVNGNLLIAQGVGTGDVTLDNVKVKGSLIVLGGGPNSIKLKNSTVNSVLVDKKDGKVRILASGTTNVGNVNMSSGGKLEEDKMAAGSEGFTSMTVTKTTPNAPVMLEADFTSVSVEAPEAIVKVSDCKIGTLTISPIAKNADLSLENGTIATFIAKAACVVAATGTGLITNADIAVSNVILETAPTNIKAADGITVIVKDVVVDPTNVYESPIPTIVPTVVPTAIPTVIPTVVPTLVPSIVPTVIPTIPIVAVTGAKAIDATTVEFKSEATPSKIIWNGQSISVVSFNATNMSVTIKVPKIISTTNTLKVSALGYTSKSVNVAIEATVGNLKLISNIGELSSAIVNQADGQSWIIKAGNYDLPKDKIYNAQGVDEAWYLPIHKSIIISGEGNPTLTSSTISSNGSWASQNFVTVFADNVTIQGFNIKSKEETNKVIEILGANFNLKDTVLLKSSATATSGVVYFNSNNVVGQTKNMGNIVLENVIINNGDVSYRDNAWGSGAMSGTLLFKNVTINNEGYGIPFNYGAIINPGTGSGITSVGLVVTAVNLKILLSNAPSSDLPYLNKFFGILKTGTKIELAAGTYFVPAALNVKDGVTLDITTNGAIIEVMPAGTVLVRNVLEFNEALNRDSTTIHMAAGTYKFDSQIRINKAINIIGSGDSTVITKGNNVWTNETGSKGYASIITILSGASKVLLKDINVTGAANIAMTPGGTDYGSGINVVSSSDVKLENVRSTNNAAAGIIVNSSAVTAKNLNTSGNKWYGVNVDKADSGDANFTLTGDGVIGDATQIFSDNAPFAGVVATGYTQYKIGSTTKTMWTNRQLKNGASITKVDIATLYSTIQSAVNASIAGDTIYVAAGDYTIIDTINVTKAITIKGDIGFATKITTSGGNAVFNLGAAATLDSIYINKTDKLNQHLITITANNATIKSSKFVGQYAQGDGEVVRGIVPNAGVKGYTLSGNHFESIRQPAYLEGAGTVTNNFVKNTRGWVVCINHVVTFTGNTFAGNAVDIAIIANDQIESANYMNVAAISAANNGAFVENQLSKKSAVNGQLK